MIASSRDSWFIAPLTCAALLFWGAVVFSLLGGTTRAGVVGSVSPPRITKIERLILDVKGHIGTVNCVRIFKIGGRTKMVSGGADQIARIWDLTNKPPTLDSEVRFNIDPSVAQPITNVSVGVDGDSALLCVVGVIGKGNAALVKLKLTNKVLEPRERTVLSLEPLGGRPVFIKEVVFLSGFRAVAVTNGYPQFSKNAWVGGPKFRIVDYGVGFASHVAVSPDGSDLAIGCSLPSKWVGVFRMSWPESADLPELKLKAKKYEPRNVGDLSALSFSSQGSVVMAFKPSDKSQATLVSLTSNGELDVERPYKKGASIGTVTQSPFRADRLVIGLKEIDGNTKMSGLSELDLATLAPVESGFAKAHLAGSVMSTAVLTDEEKLLVAAGETGDLLVFRGSESRFHRLGMVRYVPSGVAFDRDGLLLRAVDRTSERPISWKMTWDEAISISFSQEPHEPRSTTIEDGTPLKWPPNTRSSGFRDSPRCKIDLRPQYPITIYGTTMGALELFKDGKPVNNDMTFLRHRGQIDSMDVKKINNDYWLCTASADLTYKVFKIIDLDTKTPRIVEVLTIAMPQSLSPNLVGPDDSDITSDYSSWIVWHPDGYFASSLSGIQYASMQQVSFEGDTQLPGSIVEAPKVIKKGMERGIEEFYQPDALSHIFEAAGDMVNARRLAVKNPVPEISMVSPPTLELSSEKKRIVVSGSGFVQGSEVFFNGKRVRTAFINPSELTADLLLLGDVPNPSFVKVVTPKPGGGETIEKAITVLHPQPKLVDFFPKEGVVGKAITVRLVGTNFDSGTLVIVNGKERKPQFDSSQQLSLTLTDADTRLPGIIKLALPSELAKTVDFNVVGEPPVVALKPRIDRIEPGKVLAGTTELRLVIYGQGFGPQTKILVQGQSSELKVVEPTPTSVVVSVPASLLAMASKYLLIAENGLEQSNPAEFVVEAKPEPVAEPPSIVEVSPPSVTVGDKVSFTLRGTRFGQTKPKVQVTNQEVQVEDEYNDSTIMLKELVIPDVDKFEITLENEKGMKTTWTMGVKRKPTEQVDGKSVIVETVLSMPRLGVADAVDTFKLSFAAPIREDEVIRDSAQNQLTYEFKEDVTSVRLLASGMTTEGYKLSTDVLAKGGDADLRYGIAYSVNLKGIQEVIFDIYLVRLSDSVRSNSVRVILKRKERLQPKKRRLHALLVGTNTVKDTTYQFIDLKDAPKSDVDKLSRFFSPDDELESQEKIYLRNAFDLAKPIPLINADATHDKVTRKFQEVLSEHRNDWNLDDVIVFYFSGHGDQAMYLNKRSAFLATTGFSADVPNTPQNALFIPEVLEVFKKNTDPNHRPTLMLILDACKMGSATQLLIDGGVSGIQDLATLKLFLWAGNIGDNASYSLTSSFFTDGLESAYRKLAKADETINLDQWQSFVSTEVRKVAEAQQPPKMQTPFLYGPVFGSQDINTIRSVQGEIRVGSSTPYMPIPLDRKHTGANLPL